jgi:hypothetical protein
MLAAPPRHTRRSAPNVVDANRARDHRTLDGRDAPAKAVPHAARPTHHYWHVDEGEKRIAAMRVLEVVTGGKTDLKEGIQEGMAGATGANPVPHAAQPC